MIKKSIFLFLLFSSIKVFGWGIIGHRTVGLVAEQYLTKKARKNIEKILEGESLAVASNWMDDIKSDSLYKYTIPWHWVTIPDGMTYEQSEKAEEGDIIQTINRLVSQLKQGGLSQQEEANAIKMLVHLVGDIHQPLHVGRGDDMGGNLVKLKWFYSASNLHRVWDSDMIDSEKYSYTELAAVINNPSDNQIKTWQQSDIMDWVKESMNLRDQVYNLPEDKSLGYKYRYANWATVERRLLQAGIRLAGILNEIYG